jgi:hypothetical protein
MRCQNQIQIQIQVRDSKNQYHETNKSRKNAVQNTRYCRIVTVQSMTAVHKFQEHTPCTLRVHKHIAMATRPGLDFFRHQANAIAL